jgi:hypothetical protein
LIRERTTVGLRLGIPDSPTIVTTSIISTEFVKGTCHGLTPEPDPFTRKGIHYAGSKT